MPLTGNASKNIQHLKAAHPDWPHDRVVAAGLNAARHAGGKVTPKPKDMKQKLRMKDR